jgi:DNA-binding transcriptional MocR family regulator
MFHAGIRSTLELWLFMLAGQAGTPGLTTCQAAAITGQSRSAIRLAYARLEKRGYVQSPSRDTGTGRPSRYAVTPDGLALLLTPAAPPIPFDTMHPLPIAV